MTAAFVVDFAELVTAEVLEAVTSALARHRGDLLALVALGTLAILDRSRVETDPALPTPMRWIRTAARGTWIFAVRDDGAHVRARIRRAPGAQGGIA